MLGEVISSYDKVSEQMQEDEYSNSEKMSTPGKIAERKPKEIGKPVREEEAAPQNGFFRQSR